MLGMLGFGPQPIIDISLDNLKKRPKQTMKINNNQVKVPIYQGKDDISGEVSIQLNGTKNLQHQGVKIELVGQIIIEKGTTSEFITLGRELESSGIMNEDKKYRFAFNSFDKEYESYKGKLFQLKYFLRVSFLKKTKELDFLVHIYNEPREEQLRDKPLKMEVGIDECIHIEFQYNSSFYHLKDCVLGKVSFLLMKLKIKNMQLDIIKRELCGPENQQTIDNEVIGKFEIMDGSPIKGEIIPIRMFLKAFDLSPSYQKVSNKFSVKYFLNIVLIDDDERRYFKQQEINIYRKQQ